MKVLHQFISAKVTEQSSTDADAALKSEQDCEVGGFNSTSFVFVGVGVGWGWSKGIKKLRSSLMS